MQHIKILFLLLLTAFGNVVAWGEPVPVNMTVRENKTTPKYKRSLSTTSYIWVYYDVDAATVELVCPDNMEGESFIYDSSDAVVDYAPETNTTFDVSTLPSGYYIIYVSTEDWEAYGEIQL